jgi:hypothetical protein
VRAPYHEDHRALALHQLGSRAIAFLRVTGLLFQGASRRSTFGESAIHDRDCCDLSQQSRGTRSEAISALDKMASHLWVTDDPSRWLCPFRIRPP